MGSPTFLSHNGTLSRITLRYSDSHGDEQDFVFEEFVRLRVAGIEESNETEA